MHTPGALAGWCDAGPVWQAGTFTDAHQRFWDTARRKLATPKAAAR